MLARLDHLNITRTFEKKNTTMVRVWEVQKTQTIMYLDEAKSPEVLVLCFEVNLNTNEYS
jgi:hypothetical protein